MTTNLGLVGDHAAIVPDKRRVEVEDDVDEEDDVDDGVEDEEPDVTVWTGSSNSEIVRNNDYGVEGQGEDRPVPNYLKLNKIVHSSSNA